MTSLAQYIAGLVLCLVVAFVYVLARRDRPRRVVRETFLVLLYMLGAISAVVLVVLLACEYT